MAIRVIREGVLPENVIHEFTCGGCDSLLSAMRGDGVEVHDQRDGDYIRFTCPVCKSHVCVQSSLFARKVLKWPSRTTPSSDQYGR